MIQRPASPSPPSERNRLGIDRRPPTWTLLVASGLLLALAFPPVPAGIFASIGLVPLLIAIDRASGYRQTIRWAYGSFLIFSALTTWWVGSWQENADTFLMISSIALIIIHPLFFVVPIVVYRWVRVNASRLTALAMLPFLWCAGEYLHALGDASYPWLTLGNTQTYNLYYVQFIEFTGVWGLSFLLLVHNAVFTAMLFALDGSERAQRRMFRLGGVLIALTLVPPFLYGFYVMGERASRTLPPKGVTVTIVQPNVNPWDKWRTADTTNHILLNADLSRSVLDRYSPDMFLWSENAIPYSITAPGYEFRRDQFRSTVDALGIPVLTGFPDYIDYVAAGMEPPPSAKKYRPEGSASTIYYDNFNSAGLFIPNEGFSPAYRKMQLVPFGERIPFVDYLPWLMNMLSWDVGISTWAKGDRIVTFRLPYDDSLTARVATVICFESVYPNVTRQFVAEGAQLLTIITNDGWYLGTPGPIQHERFAMLRAVELRRGIARAANTGISCFIDPYGEIVSETEEGEETTLTGVVEVRSDLTLYARWGDWWPQLSLVVTAGMIVMVIVRRRRGEPLSSADLH